MQSRQRLVKRFYSPLKAPRCCVVVTLWPLLLVQTLHQARAAASVVPLRVSLQREQRYVGAFAALPPTSPAACWVVNWYLAACCTVQTQTRAFGAGLKSNYSEEPRERKGVVCFFLETKHSKTNPLSLLRSHF